MNKTIKYLCTLSLLCLIGFLTACDKENIDDDMISDEEVFPIDTILCDLDYDLTPGIGGIAMETVTITNLTGGTAPYTYNWSTGDSATTTIVAPVAGTYSVTVTDANNCTLAQSIEVTLNMGPCDSLELSIIAVDSIPGVKRLEPTIIGGIAPFDYLWSNGDNNMITTVTTDGNYSLTITDSIGCSITDSINVTIDNLCDSFAPSIYRVDTLGMVLLFVSDTTGALPYTYLWQDGSTNDALEATIIPGTYSVTVIDAVSCIAEDSIEVL